MSKDEAASDICLPVSEASISVSEVTNRSAPWSDVHFSSSTQQRRKVLNPTKRRKHLLVLPVFFFFFSHRHNGGNLRLEHTDDAIYFRRNHDSAYVQSRTVARSKWILHWCNIVCFNLVGRQNSCICTQHKKQQSNNGDERSEMKL